MGGIQIQQDSQGDDLALPDWQSLKCPHQAGIQRARYRSSAGRCIMAQQGQFPAAASPQRHAMVQGGPNHPRLWCRMPADLAPGRPSPRERLGDQLLRPILITDDSQDSAQACIPRRAVELLEIRLFLSRTP
jgi:hypothetical protein